MPDFFKRKEGARQNGRVRSSPAETTGGWCVLDATPKHACGSTEPHRPRLLPRRPALPQCAPGRVRTGQGTRWRLNHPQPVPRPLARAPPKLKTKSIADYTSLLGRYIRRVVGKRMLRDLAPLDFQSCVSSDATKKALAAHGCLHPCRSPRCPRAGRALAPTSAAIPPPASRSPSPSEQR